jgi:hypothetical protein
MFPQGYRRVKRKMTLEEREDYIKMNYWRKR